MDSIYRDLVQKISISPDKKTKQKNYLKHGALAIVDQGRELIGGYTDDVSMRIACELPVIVFGDHTRAVKYVNFPFGAGADGIKILQPKPSVFPKYLYYATQYLVLRLENKGYARHYQHLEKKELDIPSIPEQKRIVSRIEELFSQLDCGVETLKKAKQQLAVYRQAVLNKAFTGALTAEWRQEKDLLSSFCVLEKIVKDGQTVGHRDQIEKIALPELPKTWLWTSIGAISFGAEYGTSQKSKKDGKIPVLRMGNIKSGHFDWSNLVYTDDNEEIEKYQLRKGDVLFNRTNSPDLVGKTAVYRGERPAIYAGYLIRVNQSSEIDSKYLTYFLNCNIAHQYGNKVKTDGVNQSNISSQKLYTYPFPLCSFEEQQQVVIEIESRVSISDNIEQTIDATLQHAEALRQSILKKAFEGGV